jgi:hypothetical protein
MSLRLVVKPFAHSLMKLNASAVDLVLPAWSAPQALLRDAWLNVEEHGQVRLQSSGRNPDCSLNRFRLDSEAGSLVCPSRRGIPIADHAIAAVQSRQDDGPYVLGTVRAHHQ